MANSKHIIVADDDEGVSLALAEFLGEVGHRVSIASDGEALREIVAKSDRVDLVGSIPCPARKARRRRPISAICGSQPS